MDPLTHSALGIACAMAAVRSKDLRRPAALTGLAAGLLPDADIFLKSANDPLFSMEYHRHFTHGVFFTPIIALLAVWISQGLYRLGGKNLLLKDLFLPALIAALSHGFCDVWTSYGTRSWWPFSDARVTLDWISVIDPLFTLPVLVAVIIALFWRSQKWAVISLIWATCYPGLCATQKARAQDTLLEWAATQGIPTPDRLTVKPSIGNIIVWRGMVTKGDAMHVIALRCGLGKVEVIGHATQQMFNQPEEALQALGIPANSRQARDVRRFFHFSDNWVGIHPQEAHTLGDLRYASMPNDIVPLWGIRLTPDTPEQPPEMVFFREINKAELSKFWALIRGAP